MSLSYIAVDIETTGLRPDRDQIIEIGAVKYVDGVVTDVYSSFINPSISLPERITQLTGITDDMLIDARSASVVIPEFLEFADMDIILGHNIMFDFSFLKTAAIQYGYSFEKQGIDTLKLARDLHSEHPSKTLEAMCELYGITREHKHRAYDDAKAAAELYQLIRTKFYKDAPQKFVAEALSYQPKKQEPMTAKQKKYLLDLVECHKISIKINVEDLTKSTASRLIDKIILEHGMLSRR